MPYNCHTGLSFLNLMIYPKHSWEISEGRKNVVFLELKKIVPGRVWPRTKDWEVSPASNFPPQIVLTLDVLLILKVWEFFCGQNIQWGILKDFFEGIKKVESSSKNPLNCLIVCFPQDNKKLTHFKKQRYIGIFMSRDIWFIFIYICIYTKVWVIIIKTAWDKIKNP